MTTKITEVEATLKGEHGAAWEMDLVNTPKKPVDATVKAYIVNAPWAHPLWPNYLIAVISLADKEGVPPATIRLPGATHEIMVIALDPSHTPVIDDTNNYLLPINFMGQFIAENDEAAVHQLTTTVEMILSGSLSPDTDFRSIWRRLFPEN